MHRIGSAWRAARTLPRSTFAMVAVAATVFAAAALVSCQTESRSTERFEPTIPQDGALGGEPDIRVRVMEDVDGVEIAGAGRVLVRSTLGGERFELATPVLVESVLGAIRVSPESGPGANFQEGVPVRIDPIGGGLLTLDAGAYPGSVEVRGRSDTGKESIDVVTIMGVETYLPGVVVRELYPSWPLECFEAQAVCARSYAMHERARARSMGRWFDVEGTTVDQAFAGATEHSIANASVESTRGQVLTYDGGRLLRTYYSSTCGGRAGSAADTWPTGPGYAFNLAPPIQGHEHTCFCDKSPAYRWERVRGQERLSLRLRRWGQENGHRIRDITKLTGASVERLNDAGRPAAYAVTDDAGVTYHLSAEELRIACNQAVPGVPDVTREERVRSGDVEFTFEGDLVKISGRGFGHGVGMCQFGAAALAKDGWDHREIVSYYYPGAVIQRAY